MDHAQPICRWHRRLPEAGHSPGAVIRLPPRRRMVAIPGRSSQSGRPAHRLSRSSRLVEALRPRTVRHAWQHRLSQQPTYSGTGSSQRPSRRHVHQRVHPHRRDKDARSASRTRMAGGGATEIRTIGPAVSRPRQWIGTCGLSPHSSQIWQEHYDQRATPTREARAVPDVYHHQSRRKGGHLAEMRHWADRLRASGFAIVDALRARPFSLRVYFLLNAPALIRQRAKQIAEDWQDCITWHPSPHSDTGHLCTFGLLERTNTDGDP